MLVARCCLLLFFCGESSVFLRFVVVQASTFYLARTVLSVVPWESAGTAFSGVAVLVLVC